MSRHQDATAILLFMKEDTPTRSHSKAYSSSGEAAPVSNLPATLVESLYAISKAERWYLSHASFGAALERSSRKRLAEGSLSTDQAGSYLSALHLEDLALATACIENCEAAWEHFFLEYRPYLRSAAAAILRCPAAAPEAVELADSLFGELYGLEEGHRRERSLFRYFHGRSSLKTWLRAVLAQRHIDGIRSSRRFEPLADGESLDGEPPRKASAVTPLPIADPHRERYIALFTRALRAALAALELRDAERLRLYYAQEKTLAEIGRQLGEHESSVSRNLDRIRAALRRTVEETLRKGFPAVNGSAVEPGLSEAQLSLCFEYSAVDASFDLDTLFPSGTRRGPSPGRPSP